MPALGAVVGGPARHEILHPSSHGTGYESSGSDAAEDVAVDYLVASGGDIGYRRPAYGSRRPGRPSLNWVMVATMERLVNLYRERSFERSGLVARGR
jgi:hypothetical protein